MGIEVLLVVGEVLFRIIYELKLKLCSHNKLNMKTVHLAFESIQINI